MEFEWNEAKDRANRAKHGFDFTYAIRIFSGPTRQFVDHRAWNERRIVATGQVEGRYITVVYTVGATGCGSSPRGRHGGPRGFDAQA